MIDFETLELIEDDGGSLTLQCDGYVHHYSRATIEAEAEQAADDVLCLLEGEDPDNWGGNEPDLRINWTEADIRDGKYAVFGYGRLCGLKHKSESEIRCLGRLGYAGTSFALLLRDRLLKSTKLVHEKKSEKLREKLWRKECVELLHDVFTSLSVAGRLPPEEINKLRQRIHKTIEELEKAED